ncbi:MAG: hypothetical protein WKF37_12100, partial [Bryobacteraceae bacterium]
MATNEFEELVQATVRKSGLVDTAPFVQQQTYAAQPALEMGKAALEIEQLRRATIVHSEATKQNSEVVSRSSSANKDEEGSLGRTVLNTVGMVTGVGPVVAGLLSIFGSKGEDTVAPLQAFSRPSSIAIDAGLTAGGSFTEIQYAQTGLARPVTDSRSIGADRASPGKESANVQITVQTMDSRSCLDHSDQ